jgi:hypothetical protein
MINDFKDAAADLVVVLISLAAGAVVSVGSCAKERHCDASKAPQEVSTSARR